MIAESINEINNLALRKLFEGDIDSAEKYFKDNVKKNKSFVTYNNLSWFYFENGKKRLFNPRRVESLSKAKKYCYKALKMRRNVFSLRVLREILKRQSKYFAELINIQKLILEFSHNSINELHMMGYIYYLNNQYSNALPYLEKAYELIEKNKRNRDYGFITYALSLALTDNIIEANRIADLLYNECMKDSNYDIELYDILLIYYYMDRADIIIESKELLFKNYSIDISMLTIILYVLKYSKNVDFELEYQIMINRIRQRYLENNWDFSKVLKEFKLVKRRISRGKKPKVKYTPQIDYTCNYFGCIEHYSGELPIYNQNEKIMDH